MSEPKPAPALPPITLLLWEYQLTILIRALRKYAPSSVHEKHYSGELLEILETIAMEE